jgi:myo-inositol-1(or 4)-monophosphatase
MIHSIPAEFPLDEVQKRMQFLREILPAIGKKIVEYQKEVVANRSTLPFKEILASVDEHAERPILNALKGSFPDDRYSSELAGNQGGDSDFQWWIDALDGSRNYIHGNPLYCISAGLTFREHPVAGVVYVPAFHETYHAIFGDGSFKNDRPIETSSTASLDAALVASGLPYQRRGIITELIGDMSAILSAGAGLRKTGSAVLDLCWIAEGRFDGMWERNVHPWDTCAASVILREAGGRLSDFQGRIFDVTTGNIVASNGLLHNDILNILKQVREVGGNN